ncbi:hypothetical protein F4778DRAFT_770232 [Xylariomycetidae sp. FL2044]|nr:hypothetical protein F4778DRAFT_770232 [Xylariomycetidae sp. FL2044]
MDIESLIANAPFRLSEEDKKALRAGPEHFKPHMWQDVKDIIAAGDMGALRRSPTDLRNYILWHPTISLRYGGVAAYVQKEKLGWDKGTAAKSEILLQHEDDYKIIRNDWPYAFTPDVCHLVIWSKVPFEINRETGLPSTETTKSVESFLDRVFGEGMGCWRKDDRLLWFKQKVAFQSVPALEHIHVLLRKVDDDSVTKLTGQKMSEITSKTCQLTAPGPGI